MKLLTKFNLILLVLFGVGGLIISYFAYQYLMDDARREVLAQAELMMASASSVRDSKQPKTLSKQYRGS